MATPAPTAAPPNFYDNLPANGGAPASAKKPDTDSDEEIMKGFVGIFRVLNKMTKLKKELKPGVEEMKQKLKDMTVQVLKKDPKDLDSGEEKTEQDVQTASQPNMKDETHAA
jgi:hypothetical protein